MSGIDEALLKASKAMTKLDAIDALAQAATPGPRTIRLLREDEDARVFEIEASDYSLQAEVWSKSVEDSMLIAALSPELVRALIACVWAADAYVADSTDATQEAYDRARDALEAAL